VLLVPYIMKTHPPAARMHWVVTVLGADL